jgi:peptidoglycan/xylan/chitin deacetylase (PgdA/CDA1 family)
VKAAAAGALAALLLAGCAGRPTAPPAATPPAPAAAATPAALTSPALAQAAPRPGAQGRLAGAFADWAVLLPAAGDRFDAIAERFLGDAALGWHVAAANPGLGAPLPGRALAVPLVPPPVHGVTPAGVQTLTVLCYHRFAPGDDPAASRMVMPAARFEAQLAHLAREGWTAVRMADVEAFLEGRRALPPRSVLITVDDGWESFHRHAWPLLQRFRMPATLFLSTDLVGTRDGLSWPQLREMVASGWVEVQAHGKTHRNLAERAAGETEAQWRQALKEELAQPRRLIERQLGPLGDAAAPVRHLAYPYGAANEAVIDAARIEGYALAFTVRPGGNTAFAPPRALRRTMIFGDHSLEDFVQRLQPLLPLQPPKPPPDSP